MLSEEVGERLALSHHHVDTILVEMFSTIVRKLCEHEPVKLELFGRFEIRTRKGRHSRRPETGRLVSIPERSIAWFTPPAWFTPACVVHARRAAEEPHRSRTRR